MTTDNPLTAKNQAASNDKREIGAAGVWSSADRQQLNNLMEGMRKGFVGLACSEATSLLCQNKDKVADKTCLYLTSINVMSGLVFSAIAGAALEPLDVQALPEEKQWAGNAYNFLAVCSVGAQGLIVCYSSYCLYFFAASSPTPGITHRAVMHFAPFFGLLELGTYLPMFGVVAMILLQTDIFSTGDISFYCLVVLSAMILSIHVLFAIYGSRAFPYVFWNWRRVAAPWLGLSRAAKANAVCHAEAQLAEAKRTGVFSCPELHGAGTAAEETGKAERDRENLGGDGDEIGRIVSAGESTLASFVRSALSDDSSNTDADSIIDAEQEEGQSKRHEAIMQALLAEGLTLRRLRRAAALPGGFTVLVQMLRGRETLTAASTSAGEGEEARRRAAVLATLTQGELLALASAAMEGAGK